MDIPKFNSIEDILNYAILKEQEAADFYNEWSKKIEKNWVKESFELFEKEELKHKEKLLKLKEGKLEEIKPLIEKVEDLKISDYLVDVAVTPNMDYQDALVIAMKREKSAFKLYNDLAKITKDENIKSIFLMLAQEEAKHKLNLETMYDDKILTES